MCPSCLSYNYHLNAYPCKSARGLFMIKGRKLSIARVDSKKSPYEEKLQCPRWVRQCSLCPSNWFRWQTLIRLIKAFNKWDMCSALNNLICLPWICHNNDQPMERNSNPCTFIVTPFIIFIVTSFERKKKLRLSRLQKHPIQVSIYVLWNRSTFIFNTVWNQVFIYQRNQIKRQVHISDLISVL